MDIFDTYEREFKSLAESIGKKIPGLVTASGEQRKLLANQLRRDCEECEEILSQIDM